MRETLPPPVPARFRADDYFDLVERCVLDPDDPVELLEGVVVAREPQNPWHASTVQWVMDALREAVGGRAFVTQQRPFVAGEFSVPEPDVLVVPGDRRDYVERHPDRAHLVVEVADSSLPQDRLTKAGIYAAAGVPEYWIVVRKGAFVQVATHPGPGTRRYEAVRVCRRGETIGLVDLPGIDVAVDALLPPEGRSS